ncbi:MAG: thioredoxin [Clostridia bacterium]|nr:thioredoxin [Clostridia bacterium]
MQIAEIGSKNFDEEVLNSSIPVLVDFYANWCGPCKMLRPILDEVAENEENVKIVSVNIDNENRLAEKFRIMSIPCLILFKDGKEVAKTVGLKTKDEILNMMRESVLLGEK